MDFAVRGEPTEYRGQVRALRYLPNAITLLRLVAAPIAIWLIATADLVPAFWLFVAAAATDAVDGALARMTGAQSVAGSYLDALADKVLLVGIYLALGSQGFLGVWLVSLVVGRDLLLIVFAAALHFKGVQKKIVPLQIGKLTTFVQILLAAVVLGHQGPGWFPFAVIGPLCGIVAVSTVASAGAYLAGWGPRLWGRGE